MSHVPVYPVVWEERRAEGGWGQVARRGFSVRHVQEAQSHGVGRAALRLRDWIPSDHVQEGLVFILQELSEVVVQNPDANAPRKPCAQKT